MRKEISNELGSELAVSNNGMVDPVQHPHNPTLALSPTQMLSQVSLGEWKNKPLSPEVFCLTTRKLPSCCHPYTLEKCLALLNAMHVV